jgi:2-keto-3-deoxy-L-fuconate dehydrogenase
MEKGSEFIESVVYLRFRKHMLDFTGKTSAITGAGSGIGRDTAILFAKQGAVVHIIDLNEEAATSTVEDIKAKGGQAIKHICDVTNQQQVKNTIEKIGHLDIMVNSAGISHIGKAEDTSEEDFDRVIKVNVKGVYNCLQAAVIKMKAQGSGVILNLASIANHIGLADRFAYSMSKGAVYAMTLSVAKDYLQYGIRCNCISPARVHTPFVDGFLKKNYPGKEAEMFEKLSKSQPIGRMAKPVEIAGLILYLCSDEASFISGCDYPIDGGVLTLNL